MARAIDGRGRWRRAAGDPRVAAQLQLSEDVALRPCRVRDRRPRLARDAREALDGSRPDRDRVSHASRSRSVRRGRLRDGDCAERSRRG